MNRMRPAAGRLAVVALSAIVLASCAEPSYEYVRNTEVRVAFKIPADWASYSKEEVLGLPPGTRRPTPRIRSPGWWGSTVTPARPSGMC